MRLRINNRPAKKSRFLLELRCHTWPHFHFPNLNLMIFIEIIANNTTSFLTALTAIIIFYYTKETYLLRKEAQKQTQS